MLGTSQTLPEDFEQARRIQYFGQMPYISVTISTDRAYLPKSIKVKVNSASHKIYKMISMAKADSTPKT